MRYLIVMNIAGEIIKVHRSGANPDQAVRLARISVAKEKGLVPSPWAVKPSAITVQEAPRSGSGHA